MVLIKGKKKETKSKKQNDHIRLVATSTIILHIDFFMIEDLPQVTNWYVVSPVLDEDWLIGKVSFQNQYSGFDWPQEGWISMDNGMTNKKQRMENV